MVDEKENSELGDIDDWLADLDEDQPAGEQKKGQAGVEPEIPTAPSAEDPAAPPAEDSDSFGLDQSDIDKLLSGTAEQAPSPGVLPTEEPEDNADGSLGAAPLKDTLPTKPDTPASPLPEPASPGRDTPKEAKEVEDDKDVYDFDVSEFDLEGLDFDSNIPEIPDESPGALVKDQQKMASPGSPGAPGPSGSPGVRASSSGLAQSATSVGLDEQKPPRGGGKAFSLPSFINQKTMAVAILVLLALIGVTYLLIGREGEPELAITPPVREQMMEPVEPEKPELALPPIAHAKIYQVKEPGATIIMELRADFAGGGEVPLSFEIVTPPRHGRLVGSPPQVAYLPNRDFPGEDSFVFLATDGRLKSNHAEVLIIGHDMLAAIAQPPAEQVVAARPAPLTPPRPSIQARDFSLQTSSTVPLAIDWAAVWRRDNAIPFGPGVRVEVLPQDLRGRLVSVGAAAHRYEPYPHFQGEERVFYRFHYAGMRSELRQLTILVHLDDPPPPKVQLKPLAAAYLVGETVLIDARGTLATQPQNLRFEWEQLGGTKVLLEPLAGNAMVRFVAPSSFRSVGTPNVLLQVTAIDPAGRRDSKTVEILILSRRQDLLGQGKERGPGEDGRISPLWGF